MMPKKKSPSRGQPPPLPKRLLPRLAEADRLLDDGRSAEAREILIDLDRQRPNQREILELLVNACYDLKNFLDYEMAIYRLNLLVRNEPDIAVGLAGAYSINGRLGLAIQAFEDVLKRFPHHPRRAEIQETYEKFLPMLLAEVAKWGLSDQAALSTAVRHDQVRFFMEHGEYGQGARVAEQLLKEFPDLNAVRNNLAQIRLLQGKNAQAAAESHRVLDVEPDNVHALSNLARALFLSGEMEAARAALLRLSASTAPALDRETKVAEAHCLFGEYDQVLVLYTEAQKSGELESPGTNSLFLHFAAVALAMSGQEDRARKLWRQALEKNPSMSLALENLADLDRPVGERNGPWAFPASQWIRPEWLRGLSGLLARPVKQNSEAAVETAARRLLQQHPELAALLPQMLKHGDLATLEFATRIARMAETPDLIAALNDFALGQRGPDKLRLEVARFLSAHNHLPFGESRLWVEGAWSDLLLLNFEIHDEPIEAFTDPEVLDLAEEAIYALRAGDADQALLHLEKALSLAPDSPSLINNYAMAYEMKGRHVEALAMLRDLHARFPDYFFGIIAVAQVDVKQGDFPAARSKLADAMRRNRLHVTEFEALCRAQIGLFLAEKNSKGAQTWIKMWEQVSPDHPDLAGYRLSLLGITGRDAFRNLFKRSA